MNFLKTFSYDLRIKLLSVYNYQNQRFSTQIKLIRPSNVESQRKALIVSLCMLKLSHPMQSLSNDSGKSEVKLQSFFFKC